MNKPTIHCGNKPEDGSSLKESDDIPEALVTSPQATQAPAPNIVHAMTTGMTVKGTSTGRFTQYIPVPHDFPIRSETMPEFPMLKRLAQARVLGIEPCEERVVLYEGCDMNFADQLTKAELLALSVELRAIATGEVECPTLEP